ncbi:DEAD/DEAH box helicase domain protein [Leadbetterella byssophila DSM 17132]|uniref:DEAD-box ATP-dependent RNA helicase RhpA n=2 Tax=Leadbetterella TaxID=319458 RepID=E4RZ99_LEAB4|nr:DEAD/DEAH box helicase domain protein [Leadbetterella byssophila DSM 17132]
MCLIYPLRSLHSAKGILPFIFFTPSEQKTDSVRDVHVRACRYRLKNYSNKKSGLLSVSNLQYIGMQTLKFSELPISDYIVKAVEEMGFTESTPIQTAAIPVVMSGRDVIGQAQTGTGKTAAFGIPAIEHVNAEDRNTQVLILCPTRELALQVKEQLTLLAKYKKGLLVSAIYGGESYERQFANLKRGTQIVVGTPGRIMDHIEKKTLKLDNISMVILDEADEMLNMGFREDIEQILSFAKEDRQTVLFSATMSKEILNITKKFQNDPEIVKVTRKEITNTNIEQSYYLVKKEAKFELMVRLIDVHDLQLMLVFCNTKSKVDEIVEELQANGYAAEGLHGDMRQAARNQVMNKFRNGNTKILVATDVAARGIDVSGVDAVINYDLPMDLEYYVHRIGRTGRAGKLGKAFLFITKRDRSRMRDLEQYTKVAIPQGKIPTSADLEKSRINKFVEKIRENIVEDTNPAFEKIVDQLKEEGFYTHQIISALMQMQMGAVRKSSFRDEDIADEARGRNERFASKERGNRREFSRDRKPSFGGGRSAEEGMTRLFINLGRKDNVSPNHIVGAIASEAKIPGRVIGQIDMYDKFSFVEVPQRDVRKVIEGMKGKTINQREANIEVAK